MADHAVIDYHTSTPIHPMTYIPETLRQAREALLQSAAALHVIAQSLEGTDEPAPAPEPEPGEWRNDRAPGKGDEGDDGLIWVWLSGSMAATPSSTWRSPHFWFSVDSSGAYWAPGNRPAPKSPPPSVAASQEVEPQPDASPEPGTPRTGGWIAYRVPTRKDADANGQVVIPSAHQGGLSLRTWISFCFVHPGTPWRPSDHIAAPWDPTCLDHNGWIRSRLPTVEDAGSNGHVPIPVGHGGTNASINYRLIVPGQPWAPWDSSPGRFEK